MNPAPNNKLETQLARMTTWDDDVPDLWRDALDSSRSRASLPISSRLLNWKVPRWVLGTTCTAAAVLLLVAIMQPALSGARISTPRSPGASSLRGLGEAMSLSAGESPAPNVNAPTNKAGGFEMTPPVAGWAEERARGMSGGIEADARDEYRMSAFEGRTDAMGGAGGPVATPSTTPDTANDRQIVHKATIELETKDVRAAFLKAGQLVSEAGGEFVQDSALTGADDAQMRGNLTLRVAASRLPAVLNELRGLGKVRGERNDGTDVTSQAVDLEARIRNEQRVEKELLELLESRKDAALKDILDLRANLASVRNVIEQLTAQRQNLARLVSLATVLVIIRTDNAPPPEPPPPPPPGIGAYFAEAFSTMWVKGLRVLADTLATLLGTLVGGLPWWILLVVTVLIVRGVMRKRTA